MISSYPTDIEREKPVFLAGYPAMSDNANLLDMMEACRVGRLKHYFVGKSAVIR